MVFMDLSLWTRTSFETAMFLHGGHGVVLEAGKGSWSLETEPGAVMDGDTVEGIIDAARVLGRYADAVGVRSFPGQRLGRGAAGRHRPQLRQILRETGHQLRARRRHPRQALADAMTLRERLGETAGKRFVAHLGLASQGLADGGARERRARGGGARDGDRDRPAARLRVPETRPSSGAWRSSTAASSSTSSTIPMTLPWARMRCT